MVEVVPYVPCIRLLQRLGYSLRIAVAEKISLAKKMFIFIEDIHSIHIDDVDGGWMQLLKRRILRRMVGVQWLRTNKLHPILSAPFLSSAEIHVEMNHRTKSVINSHQEKR